MVKLLLTILISNLVFFIFSWWRFYSIFYIFCGDNETAWKISISLYFTFLIVLGFLIGHFLIKKIRDNVNPIIALILVNIILTTLNIFRLIRFFFWGIY